MPVFLFLIFLFQASVKEDINEFDPHETESNFQNDLQNSAKFESLCDLVATNFSEVQLALQELLQLKDDLLMHFLPPPLLFRIAVVAGNVYRAFSDLNTPIFETMRLVRIFSVTWEKNSAMLKKIHEMYENKKQLLNIAIKRLALVEKKTKLFSREKRVMNWEKLYIRLSEAKGHGRRWKFQMEAFRKKSELGYDELVHWLLRDSTQMEESEELQAVAAVGVAKKKSGRKNRSREPTRDGDFEDSQLNLNTKSSFSERDGKENDEVNQSDR